MKRNTLTLIITLFFHLSSNSQTPNSVSLSSGYVNQSFYSLSNGEIVNTSNINWDIAFTAEAFNASIRVNGGQGVELYTYQLGDTSAWVNINNSSIGNLSQPLYNSDTSWTIGAFDANQLGHPDYGWGVYNMINHYVTGDSIFIIKTVNGNWKKIWIKELAANGIYTFIHANLDGSNLITQTINKNNYSNKNFIYYSIDNNSVEDREPINTAWDITFTKYITPVQGQPYSVTGVLSNSDIEVAEAVQIANPSTYTNYSAHPFSSEINTIGYDWKYYDFSQGYVLSNDLCYFIKDMNNDIYRIVFTEFEGTSSGNISFNTELINSTSIIDNNNKVNSFSIYPNPAINQTKVIVDAKNIGELKIFDVRGREISKSIIDRGLKTYDINLNSFNKGVYIVSVTIDGGSKKEKLIIQ